MSLGLAKDSILGLSDLVRNNDEDENSNIVTHSHHGHDDQENDYDYLLFDGDEENASTEPSPPTLYQTNIFGAEREKDDENAVGRGILLTNDMFKEDSRAGSHAALNRYQRRSITKKKKKALAGAYSGFTMDYSEYASYYAEANVNDGDSNYIQPSYEEFPIRKVNNSSNIFCCLLPPWFRNNNTRRSIEDDSSSDNGSGNTAKEQETAATGTTTGPNGLDQGNDSLAKGSLGKPNEGQKGPQTPSGDSVVQSKEPSSSEGSTTTNRPQPEPISASSSHDEDESSVDTDIYGEKLSDTQRLAILARLRLPDAQTQNGAARDSLSKGENNVHSSSSVPSSDALPETDRITNQKQEKRTTADTASAIGQKAERPPGNIDKNEKQAGGDANVKADISVSHPRSLTPSTLVEEAPSSTSQPQRTPSNGSKSLSSEPSETTNVSIGAQHVSSVQKANEGESGSNADAASGTPRVEPTSTQQTPQNAPKRGILKRGSMKTLSPKRTNENQRRTSTATAGDGNQRRRSLFPTVDTQLDTRSSGASWDAFGKPIKKSVRFAPMARVVTVTPRHSMSFVEKSQVWWQKTDFDDFKKTGRIIAKAMLEGGSEIWLTSNNVWSSKFQARQSQFHRGANGTNGHADKDDPAEESTSTENHGHKWWCKFGHSRRGLEHIASIEEGRQRQQNVRRAIEAVIEEQRRQRINLSKEPNKLRSISMQYTSWARDLALAAGAADAEAVRSNFQNDAKGRSFYLQTRRYSDWVGGKISESPDGPLPSFMMPTSSSISPRVLDANTSTSVLLRRHATAPSARSDEKQTSRTETKDSDSASVEEAIHDPEVSHERIAKKAAGFGHGENGVDLSAVLSGIGPIAASPRNQNMASVGVH